MRLLQECYSARKSQLIICISVPEHTEWVPLQYYGYKPYTGTTDTYINIYIEVYSQSWPVNYDICVNPT